jgi:hypothetical protein
MHDMAGSQTEDTSLDEGKAQAERFKDAARKAGADETPDALDRIMGKLDLKKKPEQDKPAKK